jgi:hypothetical protein
MGGGLAGSNSDTGTGPGGAAAGSAAAAGGAEHPAGAAGTASGGAPGNSAGESSVTGGAPAAGTAGSISSGGASSGGASSGSGGASGGLSAGATGIASCPGLFCEDFESGQIDPAIWDTQTFGGQTVVVQSDKAAHGKYAVQFHAKPNLVSYDFIITKNAPPALHGHHFGRASFFLTPKPPAAHTSYLFSGSSGFPNFKYLEVASAGTSWQLSLVHLLVPSGKATSATGTQEAYSGGGTVPLQKWSCIAWEFNDAPDQATVYVEGKPDLAFSSISLGGVNTGLIGGFTSFGFGFYAWHPATYEFDVYYDDIVLDIQPIACP